MTQQVYNMNLITGKNVSDIRPYDYFILSPSTGDRNRALLYRFKGEKVFKKIIAMDYGRFHQTLNDEQEKDFYCDLNTIEPLYIKASNDKDVINALQQIGVEPSDNLSIDITSFSIPDLYCMMDILKNVIGVKRLDVYYTEPKYYLYEDGYFDTYNKSILNRKCKPIPGYYNAGESEQEILTIFLGFNEGLANTVYFKLAEEGEEISKTIAVNGFPSYTAKLKDVSLFNNEDLINKIGKENVCCVTADNPFDTYNLLCKILDESNNVLLNICPIGSKPMALGACLFALNNKEKIKVTYPFYEDMAPYNEEEAGKIWRYIIYF